MVNLVLASASPRRRDLLTQAGYRFRVHPGRVVEDVLPGEEPLTYVSRLAREKALAVYDELPEDDDLVVLGADTTVTLDGLILGKPEDPADAARMLRLLSGRTHHVVTGVSVVSAGGVQTTAEITEVRFVDLSDAEIAAYVATGEPMDKAGSYGIQGYAARWVPGIRGCYFNVMGLPIALVSSLLGSLS